MLGTKLDPIPSDLLAAHICKVTADMDWPVRRAAVGEVVKRWQAFRRDELCVSSRPKGNSIFGKYQTGNINGQRRPYSLNLYSATPLDVSCNCPDFLNSSLGVCKHALTVLSDVFEQNAAVEALSSSGSLPNNELRWNPVAPALGTHDPMLRILLTNTSSTMNREVWNMRKLFEMQGGVLCLKADKLGNTKNRLKIISALLSFVERTGRDPALSKVLQIQQRRLEEQFSLALTDRQVEKGLRDLKRSIFPYQREAVKKFSQSGSLLLADDMGLGKTVQAISCAQVLWSSKKIERGLLLVPASLKGQWVQEWNAFSNMPISIVDGNSADRESIYRQNKKGFLIANYEQVLRDLLIIQRWNPDMVILDEAQRIKNWQTKTSSYIRSLKPSYRLVLSGTPFENRLTELATVMDWVDPQALQPQWRLTPWHTTYIDGELTVGGARNLSTLRERLEPVLLRRRRAEVLNQLPERSDHVRYISLTREQEDEHNALSQPILKLMATGKKRPLTQAEFLRLMSLLTTQRIICNGMEQLNFEEVWPDLSQVQHPDEALLEKLSAPKLLEFRNIIKQVAIEQGRKVLVFSQWRRMLRLAEWAISGPLAEAKIESRFFTGQESQKRRRHNVIDFHDDPRVGVLFLSDAGGVGLNLQRAANCCINLDLPWNPAVLEQRIGRIYRLGQNYPIDVFNLVSDGIESRIANLVSNKKELFSGLFDGSTNDITYSGQASFMDGLKVIFEPKIVPAVSAYGESENEELEEESSEQIILADDIPLEPTEGMAESNNPLSLPSDQLSADLFSGLKIHRREDGSMNIQAEPQAANILAAMFETMARALRGD